MNIIENKAALREYIASHPELSRLVEFVRKNTEGEAGGVGAVAKDSAHDMAHFERVAIWTSKLISTPIDFRLIVAAAYLHDLVNVPKNSPQRSQASQLSAHNAREILPSYGFEPSEIDMVCDAILNHSFSRGEKPQTELGLALQDADRLESLGALGIMRTFSTGEKMRAQYFHSEDPWAESRVLDDSKYSVDHFYNKLFKLPEMMNTKNGREEGHKRVQIMKDFLSCLKAEI